MLSSLGINISDRNFRKIIYVFVFVGSQFFWASFSLSGRNKEPLISTNPIAVNDNGTTCGGIPISINVIANDTAKNGGFIDPASISLGPGLSTPLVLPSGTFTTTNTGFVNFSPTKGFTGTVSIQYTVKDNSGNVSNAATISIMVKAAPKIFTVTGGGQYCQGGTGVGVGLDSSQAGINYQLLVNMSPTGAPVPGTGNHFSFGSQTAVGTYQVVATNSITGCTDTMNGAAMVKLNLPPTKFKVMGGGTGCSTPTTGAIVSLSGSEVNVNYQLQNGSTAVGSPVAGTGSPINFPPVYGSSGSYYVTAFNTTTLCSATMDSSVMVTIYTSPTLFKMGPDTLCAGNPSNIITLSGSQNGILYQVIQSGLPVGTALSGTGSPLSFTGIMTAGTCSILGTDTITGCSNTMLNQTAIVNIPTIYALSPKTQNYCAGGLGGVMTLSSSDKNVNYQLYSSSGPVGFPVAGTGSSIKFGPYLAGNYWVTANSGKCSSINSDTVSIILSPSPTRYTLSAGSGHYCEGTSGAQLFLSGSDSSYNYQLLQNGNPFGPIVKGNNQPITYGPYLSGMYTVSISSASNSCPPILTDTVTLVQDSLPLIYTLSPDTAHYCKGGSGVNIVLSGSQVGVTYQFLKNNIPQGLGLSGTGSALSFGLRTAGTYSIIAVNSTTGCAEGFPSTSVIITDSLPAIYTISPKTSSYCSGAGVDLTLSGSELGVNYQLRAGNSDLGPIISGTGSPLDLGTQTQGSYSVLAINAKSGCSASSGDTAIINLGASPIAFTLRPNSAHYCQGDTGVHLTLSGSESGVNYQVISGGSPVGSTVPGTGNPLDLGLFLNGNYTVNEINSISNCTTSTNPVTITADSNLKVFVLSPTLTHYCTGTGVDITLSGSEIGVNYQLALNGANKGLPVPGTGNPLDFGSQGPGNYQIRGVHQTGTCPGLVSNSITIVQDSLPQNFTITGNPEYCPGNTGTTLTLSGSQTGISYQLQNLFGNSGNPQNGTGSPLQFLNVPSGQYLIVATSIGGCTATMNSGTEFTVISPLSGTIKSRPIGCISNSTGTIRASVSGGTQPYTFLWNTGSTDSVVTGLTAGNYTVTITDQTGCTLTLTGAINTALPPVSTAIQTTTTFNVPLKFSIKPFISSIDTTINLNQIDLDPSTSGTQNIITVTGKGTFTVDSSGTVTFTPVNLFVGLVTISYTVTDNFGCISNVSLITINVQASSNQNTPLIFPNVFTPNGDGVNDNFWIEGLQLYPDNTLEIFNRWGNQVFYGKGYMNSAAPWTGNGLSEGTYYYILKVNINGKSQTYSGYTVIIRSTK